MAAIGNSPTQQAFTPAIDYFSGNASTTAFTLSRPVASVAQVQVTIDNVAQNPSSAYTVSSNTITFTSAPLSGTNNIYVYYTSPITQVIAPGQGTVGTTQIQNGVTVNFADGTAAAPSITNDGDTNTGIFFPAADTIAFAEGGAESMRIDSSGKVLIGASSSDLSGTSQAMVIGSGGLAVQFGGTTGTYLKVNPGDANGVVNLTADARSGNYPAMTFTTSATERMRIDSSGNVGIGTTSTSAKLSVSVGGVSTLGQQSNQALALLGGGSNNQLCQIGMGYGTGATYTPTAIGSITTTQSGYTIADLIFATRGANTDTAPSERMRINADGRVYSGSASPWTVGSGGVNAWALYNGGDFPLTVASQSTITAIFNRCTSTGTIVEFKYNGSPKGTISTDGSTVAYNTSSDYRLKDDVATMTGALNKVSALKPVTWKWKSTGEDGEGFIAHELAEVCPQAVHGTKDEVDADGNPVYQGVDTSFLVATLTAALQETKALIDTQAETINALTARIVALETA